MKLDTLDFEATVFFMLMEGREDFLANTFGKKLFNRYMEDLQRNRVPSAVKTDVQGDNIFINRNADITSMQDFSQSDSIKNPDEIKNLLVRNLINYIMQFDPTPKNKYAQWIVVQYVKGNLLLEDLYKIHDAIEIFELHKKDIEQKDINQFKSVRDFIQAMDDLAGRKVASVKVSNFLKNPTTSYYIGKGEAKLFYQDANLLIVIPKTKEASCYFGKHTKWCTASDKGNRFTDYITSGNLYIVMASNIGKFQWHFSSGQFMDEKDDRVNGATWYNLLKAHPELIDIAKSMAKREHKEFGYRPSVNNGTFPVALTGKITNKKIVGLIRNDPTWVVWTDRVTKDVLDVIKIYAKRNPELLASVVDRVSEKQIKEILLESPESLIYLKPELKNRRDLQLTAIISFEVENIRISSASLYRIVRNIDNPTDEFLNRAIKLSPDVITSIKEPTDDQLIIVAKNAPGVIVNNIPQKLTPELVKICIKNDPILMGLIIQEASFEIDDNTIKQSLKLSKTFNDKDIKSAGRSIVPTVYRTFRDIVQKSLYKNREVSNDILSTAVRLEIKTVEIIMKFKLLNNDIAKTIILSIGKLPPAQADRVKEILKRILEVASKESKQLHSSDKISKTEYKGWLKEKQIWELSENIQQRLVKISPTSVLRFKNPTMKAQIMAMKKEPWVFEWLEQTDDLIEKAFEIIGAEAVQFINNPKPKHIEKAVEIDSEAAAFLGKTKSKKNWELLINHNPKSIAYFPGIPPEELMIKAVKLDPEAILNIPTKKRNITRYKMHVIPEKVFDIALTEKPELAKHFGKLPLTIMHKLISLDKKNSLYIQDLSGKTEETLLSNDPNHLAYIRKPSIVALKRYLPRIDTKFYSKVKFLYTPDILDKQGISDHQTKILQRNPDLVPKTSGFLGLETQAVLSENHLDKLYEYYEKYFDNASEVNIHSRLVMKRSRNFSKTMIDNIIEKDHKNLIELFLKEGIFTTENKEKFLYEHPERIKKIKKIKNGILTGRVY